MLFPTEPWLLMARLGLTLGFLNLPSLGRLDCHLWSLRTQDLVSSSLKRHPAVGEIRLDLGEVRFPRVDRSVGLIWTLPGSCHGHAR